MIQWQARAAKIQCWRMSQEHQGQGFNPGGLWEEEPLEGIRREVGERRGWGCSKRGVDISKFVFAPQREREGIKRDLAF